MDRPMDEQAVDPAAFARLREFGGDPFVIEMIDRFTQYAPGRTAAARDALRSGDATALAAAVHPLKSSAGHVGAKGMSELARQIEGMAASGSADLPALVDRLTAECDAVLRLLAGERRKLTAQPDDANKGA